MAGDEQAAGGRADRCDRCEPGYAVCAGQHQCAGNIARNTACCQPIGRYSCKFDRRQRCSQQRNDQSCAWDRSGEYSAHHPGQCRGFERHPPERRTFEHRSGSRRACSHRAGIECARHFGGNNPEARQTRGCAAAQACRSRETGEAV